MKLLFYCHCENFLLCRRNGSPVLQPNIPSLAFIPRERSELAGKVIPETKRGDNSQLSYRNLLVHSLCFDVNVILSFSQTACLLPYKGYWGCAAGWGRIFTTGLTVMGSHFQQSQQNGVESGRTFSDFWGKTVFHIYGQQTYQVVCIVVEK